MALFTQENEGKRTCKTTHILPTALAVQIVLRRQLFAEDAVDMRSRRGVVSVVEVPEKTQKRPTVDYLTWSLSVIDVTLGRPRVKRSTPEIWTLELS
jgi:hypothetical protein